MRSTTCSILTTLAIGGALGYLAASGASRWEPRAAAAPAQAAASDAALLLSQAAHSREDATTQTSCSEGLSKGQLLALADPAPAAAPAADPAPAPAPAAAQNTKRPNIVFIMGDDIGIFNIGAYHRGMMSGKTPNLDKLAKQGMLFTDYYAEASCTAGRANFITGQLPMRTGLTTVGQAGASVGMPDKSPTIATALKAQGYATGQFGKNHLGDLNRYLPTVHGFDEFFGYLYHLDAMSDPYWYSYPKDPKIRNEVGPRNMVHTWATDTDDATDQPRWGRVGKQRIEDAGPLSPERMETIDDEIVKHAFTFVDKAKRDDKPFFLWLNPTRMHIFTFLSQKYKAMQNPETNYGLYEAGMVQLDEIVGQVMKKLDDLGVAQDTILAFTTDNGAELFTWPDGGMTPFRGAKGTVYEGGFRVPMIIRWPGKIEAGRVENGIFSGLDWLPTLVAAAGGPEDATDKFKSQDGYLGYRVHLDGYNQMDLLLGKGPSKRHEVWYFAESRLGAVRIDDFKYTFITQPGGWFGAKLPLNMPMIGNLRQDPFERAETEGAGFIMDFYAREFWRFVFVQKEVAKLGATFVNFPPQQQSASFNLDEVKEQVMKAVQSRTGQ